MKRQILDILDIVDWAMNNLRSPIWYKQNKRHQIEEIMNDQDFFLQKGKEAYDEFMKYPIERRELKSIGRIEFSDVQKILDKDEEFEEILKILLSYLDESQSIYNSESSRHVAFGTFHFTEDVDEIYLQLFKHKMQNREKDVLQYSAQRAIEYLNDPESNISILPKYDRENISELVLGKPYHSNESFVADLREMFAKYLDQVVNPKNDTIFIARWFYTKEIKDLWKG